MEKTVFDSLSDIKSEDLRVGDYVVDNPDQPALAHLYRVEMVRLVLQDVEDGSITELHPHQVRAAAVQFIQVADPEPVVEEATP